MKKLYLILLTGLFITSSAFAQIDNALKRVNTILKTSTKNSELTTSEVVKGLKEALVKGAENSSNTASKIDGYFKNPALKIPFPPEIQKMEKKLRKMGFNKLVDDFVLSMNRGAEKAAVEAAPIFIDAITGMSFDDAWAILKGEDNAATQYLKRTTGEQLKVKFEPIIKKALESVNTTKYYEEMSKNYNKIPFVTPLETDLTKYVNNLAVDGLFILVAKEELAIRKDPVARTTEILQKVFSYEN